MENINSYITQARAAGQTDQQIRQNLISAGWQVIQIDQALGGAIPQPAAPSPPSEGQVIHGGFQSPNQLAGQVISSERANPMALPTNPASQPLGTVDPQASKPPFKLLALVLVVLVLIVICGGGAYALLFHKTSYQAVAEEFVTAMEKGDKAKANALVDPKFIAQLKQYTGTSSVYDSCKQQGSTCTYYFSAAFLNKAVKTTKNEGSKGGVQKRQVIYTLKQTSNNKDGDCSASGSSTQTLTIELEAKGKSWLVDDADPETNFSASLCPTSSDTTTGGAAGSDSDSSDSNSDNSSPATTESISQ